MIKNDMILSKSGQGRSNQVTFIQKQISMKPNEVKNIGLKKTVLVSKEKFINQAGAKFFTKDGKLLQMASKIVNPSTQVSPVKVLTQQPTSQQSVTQQQSANQGSPQQAVQQQSKTALSAGTPIKIKSSDIKREKRKSDTSIELISKGDENSAKSIEIKTLDS